MPKIVDHDQNKLTIAGRAVEIFSSKGYSAIGMRELAAALGMSKSALYHYFPTKKALFAASSAVAINRSVEVFKAPQSKTASKSQKIDAIVSGVKILDKDFLNELFLLSDYLRQFSPSDVKKDPALAQANIAFLRSIEIIVGAENAQSVLLFIYGFLFQRVVDGKTIQFSLLKSGLNSLI
jgi:TetR/AcrR family transcriptional regulator, transcriptional repressor of aconitase